MVGNCRKLGAPKVFYIAADMASPDVPERVVQFALDKLGEGRGVESGTLAQALGAWLKLGRGRGPWGRGWVGGGGGWWGGGDLWVGGRG